MNDRDFLRRVAAAIGLLLLGLATYLLLWHALHFVLLVFAGILLAVFLNGLAAFVVARTGVDYRPALGIVGIVLLVALGGVVWLIGPDLAAQVGQVIDRLPAAIEDVRVYLERRGWGRAVLERLPDGMGDTGTTPADLLGRITGVFSSTLGAAANVLIVFFLGIYLAFEPGLYRRGSLFLVPRRVRGRAAEVLDDLGRALRRWLAGIFASMAVVAVLSAVALLVLGVPLVLGLAVLTGLLSFVPVLGPVAAAVPAMLVGFAEGGPILALWVAVAYSVVQTIESYLIAPMILKRMVALPPAILISAQILMGLAAGVLGVLLATPLAVVAIVLVQTLYVRKALGEDVATIGA